MEAPVQIPENPAPSFNGMPCGMLGQAAVSRLVFDGRTLEGHVHSRDLKYVKRLAQTYHTPQRVRETLQLAEASGINTVLGWGEPYVREHNDSGGKLQFIARLSPRLAEQSLTEAIQRNVDRGAIAHFTDPVETDEIVRQHGIGPLAKVIEKAAGGELPIGVGTWALPVVVACEEGKLPLDFYVKSFHSDDYPTTRPTPPPVRNEYIQHTPGYFDNIWCADPVRVIEQFGSITKPWLATQVLAAGAIDPRRGLAYAVEEAGVDFAAVAMFDFQVAEYAETVKRLITRAARKRTRPWRA
jgi:hypothetical protein